MSNIIDLSSKQTLMDTDNQFHSLPNENLSAVNVARNDSSMELYPAPSVFDAFKFVLLNGNMNNNQNKLTNDEERKLIELVQNYNGGQILNLAIRFAALYNIYLHFIAFHQGKFQIVNEYSFPDQTKERQQAFIVLNGDFTVCGPLSLATLNGRQAVYQFDDSRAKCQAYKYIEELNRSDPRLFPIIQVDQISTTDQNSSNDMQMDISLVPVESNAAIFDTSSTTMEVHTSGDKIMDKIIKTSDPSRIQGPDTSLRTVRSNESARVSEDDQIFRDFQASSSTHPPNTMQASQTIPAPPSTPAMCPKPEIVVGPKSDWKLRHPTDLKLNKRKTPEKKSKSKIRKPVKEKKMVKYIELLQGVDGKGSRITVEVPPREQRTMYLAVTVRTINDRFHSSKVVVPKGTKVNAKRVNHKNPLNDLEFDDCDAKDFFDLPTRTVYLEITSKEHGDRFKYVPVYMFNLYQNQQLTKDMIKREQLYKCKLAFWLCVKENGNYTRISHESLSHEIVEKKRENKYDPP